MTEIPGVKMLKTGLFGIGYNKKSVFAYIAQLTGDYEAKLTEAKSESEKKIAELSGEIDSLKSDNVLIMSQKTESESEVLGLTDKNTALKSENDSLLQKLEARDAAIAEKDAALAELSTLKVELEALKKENATLHRNSNEVAEILADAKNFANLLRDKAVEENEEYRRVNRERNEAEKARLEAYKNRVDKVRSDVVTVLRGMELSLNEMTADISKLLDNEGEGNEE